MEGEPFHGSGVKAWTILLVTAATLARGFAAEVDRPTLTLGSVAPEFSLPGVDGKTWSLADFKAPILVVMFTCNHCPTAQAYEGRLQRLVADYRPRGVDFVAINPNSADALRLDELGYTDLDDSFESMKIRAAQRGFDFPYLDDGPSQAVARLYGPVATPHLFIFDAQRRLHYQGRVDDSERENLVKSRDARAALDALLAGREPSVASTRVFGCSVKWAEKSEANRQWLDKVRSEAVAVDPVDAEGLKALRINAQNKVRLVTFWATWCGPCITEFDDFLNTNLRFRHRDFELVTVAAQFPDERPKVLEFLERHHASTRNLYFGDPDKYRLIEAFDPEWNGALPYTLLIGPSGKVLYRQSGAVDFLELRRRIVPALNAITPWGG